MTIITTTCSLQDKLEKSLILINHTHGNKSIFVKSFPSVAVAYSGGLDSSVLLYLMIFFACQHKIRLHAFHIHHGISSNSDNWQQHCQEMCKRLKISFRTRNVILTHDKKNVNIEETARIARYQALGQLCREQDVNLLLTGHHLNDQAETIFLQLLRGCGFPGISGMGIASVSPNLLGNFEPHIVMGRPLLEISRDILKQHAKKHTIVYVEDDSNNDIHYTRNMLRHYIMPALSNYFPGFHMRFARTAMHAQSVQRLLKKIAQQNFDTCRIGKDLSLLALRKLDSEEFNNLLRYWLALHDMRMPSTAWLLELRKQLLTKKHSTKIYVTYLNYSIQIYRDRVFITPRHIQLNLRLKNYFFVWNGENKIYFSEFEGSLLFDTAEIGLNAIWLRQQLLCIRLRQGGERFKLVWNRPIKNLKYYYQAMKIPMEERVYLPLIFSGNQLVYAAGLGIDYRAQCVSSVINFDKSNNIRLRWQFE